MDDKLSQVYASKLEKRYTSRQPLAYNPFKDKSSPNRSNKNKIPKNENDK